MRSRFKWPHISCTMYKVWHFTSHQFYMWRHPQIKYWNKQCTSKRHMYTMCNTSVCTLLASSLSKTTLNCHQGNMWKRPSQSSWARSLLLSSDGSVVALSVLSPWDCSQKSLSSEDEMITISRLLKSHTAVRWKAMLEKTTRYSNRAKNV